MSLVDRLFSRPHRRPPVVAGLEEGGEEASFEPAEGTTDLLEPPRSRRRLKLLLALLLLGGGAVTLWSQYGSLSRPPARETPSLLPTGPGSSGAPARSTATEATASAPASGPDTPALPERSRPASEAPTFFQPLPRHEGGVPAAVAGRGLEIAQAQHEALIEGEHAKLARAKLERLRADLEADQLKKHPELALKGATPAGSTPALPSLPSLPPPVLNRGPQPRPGVRASDLPLPALAAPPKPADPVPPQIRVRMVTVDGDTPEALFETEEQPGGVFRVRERQQFPSFTVEAITVNGVTIRMQDRRFFYPVGGLALGSQPPEPAGRRGHEGERAPAPARPQAPVAPSAR